MLPIDFVPTIAAENDECLYTFIKHEVAFYSLTLLASSRLRKNVNSAIYEGLKCVECNKY